jgi:hypothetical protein
MSDLINSVVKALDDANKSSNLFNTSVEVPVETAVAEVPEVKTEE